MDMLPVDHPAAERLCLGTDEITEVCKVLAKYESRDRRAAARPVDMGLIDEPGDR